MQHLSEDQVRQLVVQYREKHPDLTTYAVAQYFFELDIPQRTTYSILKHYEERGSTARASGSGHKAEKMPAQRRQALVRDTLGSKRMSQRDLARKYDISVSYVNKVLQEEGVKAYKRQPVPHVTESQAETQRVRVDRLYRHILASGDGNPSIVMDDESYFTLSHAKIPQNQYYYSSAAGRCSEAAAFSTKQKFESKVLVWLAISDRGTSRIFFCPSKQAINKEVYTRECIEKRLEPFISEHHSDGNYLFWPDLASSHYARDTLARLDELGIQYVPKEMNPPNVPQLRPIEDFWGWLKQLVYANGWQAQNIEQLQRRVQYCFGKVEKERVHAMMQGVKSKIRTARAQGVASAYH